MQVCDLRSGLGDLKRATAKLKQQWEESKSVWKDEASRTFQEQYLQPLLPHLQMTGAAIQRFADVVEKAEKECDDAGM